ncbi:MAG: DUF4279 domain-containing protein [Gammaproteobacteria bacterium]|nr:DUF4279 domain-containing protein [Gammaproteobacteria bacterium]
MSCTETYATLRVFSKQLMAQEICNSLELNPSTVLEKYPDSKYKHEREDARFFYTTKGIVDSKENLIHLMKILDVLEGKNKAIDYLANQECEIDIFCYFETDGQGGPTITSEIMKRLSLFNIDVSWDIYCVE